MGAVLGQLRLPGIGERKKLRVAAGSTLTVLIGGLDRALAALRRPRARYVWLHHLT